MNSKHLLPLSLTLALAFIACKKESDTPQSTNTTTNPTPTAQFSWSIGGGTSVQADDAYFVAAYNNIYATKTGSNSVDIVLEDLSKNTHIIAPSAGITLQYTQNGTTYDAKSGSVTISNNTGSLISGSYSCTIGSGTITTLSGSFSNLPKK